MVVERDEGAAVDGFARLEGLRDAEEREFRQGAGCEGRQGRERFERAAVRAELLPFAEVGGGQERIGVQTGVRALPVHGAGREGRQGRERFERADLHRQRVPFPAVDVQNGRPAVEVGDGLVPSLVRAVARACAVARVRQSGHDRRRGDDAGVRSWWKATVPSAGSTRVGLSFSYGSTTDDNGGKLYDVKGESAAVSGGRP